MLPRFMRRLLVASVFLGGLLPTTAARAQGRAHETVFERWKDSVLTIEVLPLAGESKSSLGSGWIAGKGRIVTNYHVVGSYIRHPGRYSLQAKNGHAATPAKLVAFDLVNDLALLEAAVSGTPFALARDSGQPGNPVIAFGNPEGLGLSLVEGVFNGFADKGFIDRMLLSMPLNPGMSGGPIIGPRNEVVGTNVSVSWRANSLSFGVPVQAAQALLAAPPIDTSARGLAAEVNRQMALLERRARERAVQPLVDGKEAPMTVGGALLPRLPDAYECWNQTQFEAREQVRRTAVGCNLQFTPLVEDIGEVASIEVMVEHIDSRRGSAYGFYGGLAQRAAQLSSFDARPPGNGIMSPPECRSDRVRTGPLVLKVNACSYAFVQHPGLGNFVLTAMSESRPREAIHLVLQGKGLTPATFADLSRTILAGLRFQGAP
jgi:hypothetical protein